MMTKSFAIGLVAVAALAACTAPDEPVNGDAMNSSVSSSSRSSSPSTANVSYRGTVEPAGVSIFMEGTHRLVLENGSVILLESETVDLNGYVGEEVQAVGSLRPTVEGDSSILTVQRITLTAPKESSSSSSSESSVSSSESSVSSVFSSSSSSSAAPVSSPPVSSATSSIASEPSPDSNDGLQARIALMAGEDLSAGRWTQRYCTEHIGFCVPVHKNWWYKSFGATTSDLWHVEVSTADIENLGDGPVRIRLMSGALEGAADGDVRVSGGMATGYRAWTDNRHFVVTGDASLEAAIRIMTQGIEAMATE